MPLAPLVSIVIPCYRQAHFVGESIESALSQTYPHVEVIVVDDGSPDNTEEVVLRYPGVRYVRQPNGGLASARNLGLRRSNGEYVIFLDADDRLLPGAALSGLNCLKKNPRCAFAAGHFRFIAIDGQPLVVPERRRGDSNPYLDLIRDYFVGPPGVVFYRREVLDTVIGFDSSVSPAADYDIALRVARDLPVCLHDDVVLEYRRHGGNMSSDPAGMLVAVMTVLRRQWKYVKTSAAGRLAYRDGVRHWQRSWGVPLVDKIVADAVEGAWKDVFRQLCVLARYYPAGLLSVWQRWKRDSQGVGGRGQSTDAVTER